MATSMYVPPSLDDVEAAMDDPRRPLLADRMGALMATRRLQMMQAGLVVTIARSKCTAGARPPLPGQGVVGFDLRLTGNSCPTRSLVDTLLVPSLLISTASAPADDGQASPRPAAGGQQQAGSTAAPVTSSNGGGAPAGITATIHHIPTVAQGRPVLPGYAVSVIVW